jgi:chemotaxis protein MotB
MAPKTQPIIVIKKKGRHGGHHGGAWKVAYADFVTAMMSLFIVLWLMGMNSKIKQAVAGYFNDPKGVAALLGTTTSGTGAGPGQAVEQLNTSDLEKLKEKIEKEIKARKDLEKLSKQIEIKITPEGLRIELLEGKNGTFFELGSPKLSANGQSLLSLLGAELKTIPNSLLLEGHTDSTPYSVDNSYSNWDLSADRANSARRLLQQDGVRSNQVTQVRGYADMMLRVKNNPTDPSNRRISILVKNDNDPVPTLSAAKIVDGSTPLPGAEKKSASAVDKAKPQAAQPITAAGTKPVAQAQTSPEAVAHAQAVASIPQAKPSPSTPAAKPSLIDRLKSMMPGKKK